MDDKIILRKHDDSWQIVVSKNDYVLAESRDVIQLLSGWMIKVKSEHFISHTGRW